MGLVSIVLGTLPAADSLQTDLFSEYEYRELAVSGPGMTETGQSRL